VIPIAIEELESLGLGELNGFGEITGLEIDSRRVGPGDLFVAIRGGREFVDAARDRGAATLVPSDEFAAMAILGQALRGRSRARFVGVTGSTGKTSTKDILAALCSAVAPTVWTEGSYNAELGVPLTLGRLEPETEICIIEMGMRGFGQIAELCEIVRPHVGVISAVGPVHLELVGSVDGVARSKAELVAALPPDGIAIVPVSTDLEPHLRTDLEILRVPPVDVELREDGAHVAFGERRIRFPLTSRHQAQNALTALTAYEAMDLPLDRLEEGAASVQLSKWRGEELALPGGGFVVNDAYNANPTSMEAALRHLAERGAGRRRLAILGGMAELGDNAERHHREIAELAGELGIELLAVGELARAYGADAWEPDAAAALAAARHRVEPGDAVLVKASRSVALEGIAPTLANDTA
jgi:UDP-N-acetylmuramoyl-tripeptide--D-alanyl-D-alanine ligase